MGHQQTLDCLTRGELKSNFGTGGWEGRWRDERTNKSRRAYGRITKVLKGLVSDSTFHITAKKDITAVATYLFQRLKEHTTCIFNL